MLTRRATSTREAADGLLRTRKGKAEGLFEVDLAALGLIATGADADDWCPEDPIDELLVALKPYAPRQYSSRPRPRLPRSGS